MEVAQISPGLPRRGSAPALLLRLPSFPDVVDTPHPISGQFTYLHNSQSAPSLTAAIKDSPPYQELSDENTSYEKEHEKNLLRAGPGNKLIDSCVDESAAKIIKTTTSIIDNDSQQPVNILPSCLPDGEPLRNLRNFSNQSKLSRSASSSMGLLLPLTAKAPSTTPPNTRSLRISKRLSTKCLQAFRKLRPHSVFSSDYHLSASNSNENGAQTPTHRLKSPRSSILPQKSIFFTAADCDAISSQVKETHQGLESPGNRAMSPLSTLSIPENTPSIFDDCSYLPDEQETVKTKDRETVSEEGKYLHNTSSSDETQSDQYKITSCVIEAHYKSTTSPRDSFGNVESNNNSSKEDSDKSKENYNDGAVETRSSPVEIQPIRDTEKLLDWQEALNELEPHSPRFVYKKLDAENPGTPQLEDKSHDCPKKLFGEPEEAAFKRSRLATWRHRKFDTLSLPKAKFRNQLEGREKTAVAEPHSSNGANLETAKVKKTPSLLFRLWSSMTSEPERNQTRCRSQKLDDTCIADQKVPSHPLQMHHATATRAKKDQGRALRETREPIACETTKDTMTEDSGRGEDVNLRNLQVKNIVAANTSGLGIVAGGLRKRDKFGGSKKELEQGIEPGKITVDDFSEPKKPRKCYPVLSPDVLPITYPKPPALGPAKRVGVSWSKSVQEYAGSLGHVHHSGERPVSDIFRSGSSDFSGTGFTDAGIPTLGCLKNKTLFDEEPLFEETSLAADWDVAMRMMEEFSKADRKLKRAGAVKHKRNKEGSEPGKDGIGRSFSNERSSVNMGMGLIEFMPNDLEEDDYESETDEDSSTVASLEVLEYGASKEIDGA